MYSKHTENGDWPNLKKYFWKRYPLGPIKCLVKKAHCVLTNGECNPPCTC